MIQNSSDVKDKLRNNVVVDLLTRKLMNSRNFGGSSALPQKWNELNQQNLFQVTRNLDAENTGYIEWKKLLTCLILLYTPILSDKKDVE
mmetsp:Transcript_35326/g.25770  ORF Transcript_35326/g.25770 Transcript_35326/m.25770 type:complete len:89 (-) Transcript_35326:378-644(-)